MTAWLTTFSGRRFYPEQPERSEFAIEDIAHGLANTCRFTGQCREFYSVAQHSVVLAGLVAPEDAPWALMHDASEAYLADLPTPVKHTDALYGYRCIERETMIAIALRFGLSLAPGAVEPDSVRTMDHRLCHHEAKSLGMWTEDWGCHADLPPLDAAIKIHPLVPRLAELAFLAAAQRLLGVGAPARLHRPDRVDTPPSWRGRVPSARG